MISRDTPEVSIRYSAEGLAEVERYIADTPRVWSLTGSVTNDNGFAGCSWSEAIRYAREGWSEGAAQIAGDLSALPPPTTTHTKRRRDVAGYYPDVPRYLSGAPDCMETYGPRIASSPVVHIVANLSASAYIGAGQMRNYGLAAAAVIDKLEASGRRVEVDAVFGARQQNMPTVFGWKVKRASEPLDLGALAFSLAHAAALRRITFALIERLPQRLFTANYGSPRAVTLADVTPWLTDGDAWVFNGIGANKAACTTRADALAYMVEQANACAGETIVEIDG